MHSTCFLRTYVKSSTDTINHDKVFLYCLEGVAQNLQLTKMAVLQPFLANFPPSKYVNMFHKTYLGSDHR